MIVKPIYIYGRPVDLDEFEGDVGGCIICVQDPHLDARVSWCVCV